ncbi:MAG: folate-binding protein YgfZ [Gallionella sp.]|nr:folate-binding protein YgfZ [Gallionella sp.]
MNTDWQNFLTEHHAHLADGVVQHFGNQNAELNAAAHHTVLCDLSQFGTLRVSGEDAQTFLQNLLSNDIRNVDGTHAQLSSFNTAKGRMLAVFLIWREGEDYLLQLPITLLEPLRKKLSMYVLRAKVKLSDANHERVSLGVAGVRAEAILRDLLGDLPQENLSCLATEQVHVLKINDTRYQLNTTPQHAEKLWTAINADAQTVGSVCWDWLNIHSGIPVVLPKTQEEFVPQMANLDVLGGINFKKGCYPGQEIVARMHYLGKLKRRMYLAHLACPDAPQAGDELFSADMEGQASGMIANAAPAPDGGYDILAVIQTASVESAVVRTAAGVALEFLTLPYALP